MDTDGQNNGKPFMPVLSDATVLYREDWKVRFVLVLGAMILITDALGGALRYYASQHNLELALYLPKLLVVIAALFPFAGFYSSDGTPFANKPVFWVYYVLVFSIGVGVFNSVSPGAIAFMGLQLMPFILGLLITMPSGDHLRGIARFVMFLWVVTCLGIWADYFIDFPWKGGLFEIYGSTIELSRSWSTFGVERPAGFTRISATAAFYVGILGLMLMVFSRSFMARLGVVLATLATMAVTTTKSAVAAAVVVLIFRLLHRSPKIRIALFGAVMAAAIILPLSFPKADQELPVDSDLSEQLFYSFNDRTSQTWPYFVAAIQHGVVGEGVGGVGTANMIAGGALSRPSLNVADSFPLYLMGWLGFAGGIAVFLWLGYSAYGFAVSGNKWKEAIGTAGLFILLVGITIDVIETVPGCILLGIMVRGVSGMDSVHSIDAPE
ncbi:hypothetical protein [Chlorobium sp. N1]|uniref:hypothetical protein n=1 Tax=Chlorobium sp. N1 TaxID=2491138 RepID=UPI00103B7F3E|nr:hypothetical protein [Chlorobium sp. N1]TCD47275.1 hypothetical protein E0L29_08245 [Chlorobium sp. N1]